MERSAISQETNLPGYDILEDSYKLASHEEVNWGWQDFAPFVGDQPHRAYLEHPVYDHYLRMHKVLVGEGGAEELITIGNELNDELLPRYLDAAGWAYAEASLAVTHRTTKDRVDLLGQAEEAWQRGLMNYHQLAESDHREQFIEDSMPFRMAMNLAYAPLMKSVVVGNVTESVRQRTFADTLAIGQAAEVQLYLASQEHDKEATADFVGLLHETNALLTLLYLNDPRYIPLPSSARADTGYYHPDQTHDISLINQHWGVIRKIIPLEIKSSASLHDRQRYKALIIRGKMHLAVDGKHSPTYTLEALADVFDHRATKESQRIVDHASTTVRELLRLYQQGVQPETIAMHSLTRFHDTSAVESRFPELSRIARTK